MINKQNYTMILVVYYSDVLVGLIKLDFGEFFNPVTDTLVAELKDSYTRVSQTYGAYNR
jgi:hypothetical protein